MAAEDALVEELRQHGYVVEHDQVGGVVTPLASRGDFRWYWFATYLRVYVTIRPCATATDATVAEFCDQSFAFAKRRFKIRGLQTGVAVIPVLLADEVDLAAIQRAEGLPVRGFAATAWPVVIDRGSGRLHYCPGGIVIGAVYESWLLAQIDAIAAAADVAHVSAHELTHPARRSNVGGAVPNINRIALIMMLLAVVLVVASLAANLAARYL